MMHHPSRLPSPRRLLFLSPLLLATAAVLAAERPPAAPETTFKHAEELRLRAAEKGDAALFADAAGEFGAATTAFASRDIKEKADPDWAFRARCAQGETLLRAGKAKEARDVLAPLLQDPARKDDPLRVAVLFYHGAACFRLGDDMAAGRSLDQLAPFQDPTLGVAARRLLARLHERADERAEALAQYDAVVIDFAERKGSANGGGPAPRAVFQSAFAAAVLLYEAGRFADAHDRFAALAPDSADARLYQGCCKVQLRQFSRGVETLSALKAGDPLAAGQALLWLGRAEAGAADPEDADAWREGLHDALETYRKAEEKFQTVAAGDDAAFARARRGETVRERAEVHERLGEFAEAADLYARLRADGLAPGRDEETLQRELTARTLAGDPAASEKLAGQFEASYPHGVLAPEVYLRRGENSAMLALRAAPADAARLNAEAARRFQLVLDKYPEFEHVQHARYAAAWLLYRQGEYDKARTLLEEIPTTDRREDLIGASYLLADCLIRTAPAQADDALAAGRLQEQLTQAADLLTDVVAQQLYDDRGPDALMRLGQCQRRLAALAAKDEDRNALEAASRTSFERVLLEYPNNDLQPHAILERARWVRKGGDQDEAVRRLRPFASGPLDKHPLAPLAVLNLCGWLRLEDGKAAEAARILGRTRRKYEKVLKADAARAEWAPLLRFQHAVALQDAGQYTEARALLKEIMDDSSRPESAEARLVWGEGMLAEGQAKVAAADGVLGGAPAEADAAAARKGRADGVAIVRSAAEYMSDQARRTGDKAPSPLLQARLFYETAWVWRSLADDEVAAERTRIQDEWKKKAPKNADGQTPDPPDVPLSDIPLQPAETKARAAYAALIAAQPELLPLAAQARLELAELLAQRGDHRGAVAQLKQAIDQEPANDVSARIGLRLSDCLFALGDDAGAMRQLDRVGALTDTSLAPTARYRAAAWLAGRGEWDKVAPRLTPFRDDDALKNLPAVTDKALLLLGETYAALGQDDASTQAYEQLLAAFADSGFRRHAHYGEALTLHKRKKYDDALTAYLRAYAAAPPEIAVRSQIQVGVCEIEMGKLSEAVESLLGAFDPDFPDMNAFALVEAAYALDRLGRAEESEQRLQQCVADYPKSPWGRVAETWLKKGKRAPVPPHALPEAAKLLALDPQPPVPLDPLGEQQPPEQSVFDDLVDRACQAAIVNRPLTLRPIPSPLLRLTTPEPFENRDAVRVRALSDVEELPPVAPLPTPPR